MRAFITYTVSPERKYALLPSPVLKTEEGQMKGMRLGPVWTNSIGIVAHTLLFL